MRDWQIDLLVRATGEGLDAWSSRIAEHGFADEPSLRDWLGEQGVTGYTQMLLVHERFGYPDFLRAGADELLDGQYADRPALRPILDALLGRSSEIGDVTVQARKTYVTLVSPRRTFAQIKATTRTRVDLGLRLPGQQPGGRLLAATSLGDDTITVRIALALPREVDDEVLAWLRRAYVANA
ncbi:MAG: hypothetical protein GEV09_11460 [Pseudonocardiaceae bacterium]|nr:hypothetical protein [Pseudonocardiaceae bacterium]